jgi:hypothetical protein
MTLSERGLVNVGHTLKASWPAFPAGLSGPVGPRASTTLLGMRVALEHVGAPGSGVSLPPTRTPVALPTTEQVLGSEQQERYDRYTDVDSRQAWGGACHVRNRQRLPRQ